MKEVPASRYVGAKFIVYAQYRPAVYHRYSKFVVVRSLTLPPSYPKFKIVDTESMVWAQRRKITESSSNLKELHRDRDNFMWMCN